MSLKDVQLSQQHVPKMGFTSKSGLFRPREPYMQSVGSSEIACQMIATEAHSRVDTVVHAWFIYYATTNETATDTPQI